MAFWLSDMIFGGVMKSGWSGVKNAGRGARGKYIKKDKETGLDVSVSPFRDGIIGDLKKHTKEFTTGKDTNGKKVNRLGSLGEMVNDVTIAPLAQGAGWTAGTAAKIGAGLTIYGAPKAARLGGHLAKGTMDVVGDTAINGAEFVMDMSKSKRGQTMLFAGAALPLAAAPLIGESFTEGTYLKDSLAAKVGTQMEGLPGTTTEMMENSIHTVDNMNADGDLVFAMHNLR